MEMKNLSQLMSRLEKACQVLGCQVNGEEGVLSPLWEELPFIAIVGNQSSGKSSVLEGLVRKNFLPHGSATRRPLVLQIHNLEEGTTYAEFSHYPGKQWTDLAEIKKEIECLNDQMGHVSADPIHLSFYSHDSINVTLIDLPGLTKVATDDQPESIGRQIEDMVRYYIKKPNCIILAISPANEELAKQYPANQDLATSNAIRLSREVDPRGERTIRVLTKIDLTDQVTNTVKILEENTYKPIFPWTYNPQFPWIGVFNHTPAHTNEAVDLTAARHREQMFFAQAYSNIADRMGIDHLEKLIYHNMKQIWKPRILLLQCLIHKILFGLVNKYPILLQNFDGGPILQMQCILEELRIMAFYQLQSLNFSLLGKGILSPVVDQMHCSICWILVALGATESLFAQIYGDLLPLSAQHVLDCYKYVVREDSWMKEDEYGCFSNAMTSGFEFIMRAGVRQTKDYHPLEYMKQDCRCMDNKLGRMGIKDFESITASFEDIERILREQPVAAGMVAFEDIMTIRGEVYCPPPSTKPKISKETGEVEAHAILIVSCGIENGIPYYLVKGSYGKEWGIEGYAKIARHLVFSFTRPLGPFIHKSS